LPGGALGERAACRTTRAVDRPYAPAVDVVRPTTDRLDEALAVLRASETAVYGDSDWTADELREEWEGLDLERDAWLVQVDGRIAGVAHLLERKGGRYFGDAYVHPELTGRSVGARVLELLEERVRELRPEWPDSERIVLEAAHLVGDERAPVLFAGRGFERMRSFFRMVIDVTDQQPDPVWPKGVELRLLEPDGHGPMLYEAEVEAFADEWDYVALDYDAWRERVFGRRGFDPALVPVAWAADEVVAFSRNYAKRNGDWGFVGTLGVRPAWRRRGLGLALLHESFGRFRETGEKTVALGVDVENPTGATRLYERAGMRVLWQADVWQKELRPA
jgi:mycothiol synthase